MALWFVLEGFVCLISGVFLFATAWFVLNNKQIKSYILPIQLTSTLVSLGTIVLGYFTFKVSEGLHKLEAEAFKGAHLLLMLTCILSAISLIGLTSLPVVSDITWEIAALALNIFLLFLLRSDRHIYQNNSTKKLIPKIIITLLFLFAVSTGNTIITQAAEKKLIQKQAADFAQFMQNYDHTYPSTTSEEDQKPLSWTEYVNTNYNFRFEAPAGWYSTEFNSYAGGPWTVAFSSDTKPTASHEDSWDFYVRIFPVTNTYYYRLYQNNLESADQDGSYVQSYTLDSKDAILINNDTIKAEYGDYVYELHLNYQLTQDLKLELSDTSRHISDSFNFF